MSEAEKPNTGKAIAWGIVGFVAGGWLGMIIQGLIGGVIGGAIAGWLAFSGSKKNNGAPPSWLWRSKKK